MRILLLATAYNSLTQRVHVELAYRGYDVSLELAFNNEVMLEAAELYQPDVIIAPFLKKRIPETLWSRYLCIIIHPGIKGDRGPSSLDWAIMNNAKYWGVTALQATEEMDAGDIWSSVSFKMPPHSKGCVYRTEVAEAAVIVTLQTLERIQSQQFRPEPLDYSRKDVQGCLRPYLKQEIRAIDWTSDSSFTIVKKIRAADSQPGVLDTIFGEEYYLYGAHEEDMLKGTPGDIIAQQHGAICRATVDGAVWISHIKKKKQKDRSFFKLPAAMVLRDRIKNVPELTSPRSVPLGCKTYKEIWYEQKNDVGYLHFDFYNGAMSTDQCNRLRIAFLDACTRPTKVIVLMGGHDFWSNGIHLNIIEAAENPAEESWRNINAMNDLVQAIITTTSHLVIAAMQGNAAAGGAILALAADKVYARSGIVLNPHYKRMGLYGSEYWTYLLPKRVGQEKALELTSKCTPMCTQVAKKIGLIDDCLESKPESFRQWIRLIAEEMAQSPEYEKTLALKKETRLRDERVKPLEEYRKEELEQMKLNFYGSDRSYHVARHNFVHKIAPQETPLHLAKHRHFDRVPDKCIV
ncbi:MAG: hydrogenase maturation protein [Coleofasciculaceae cyanobacterium]